ncbi:hypothetical protein [Escherichia coli]|uniref:hypothetical protein n=1 Tax=Escherichia coli TaxID=562 RepID=UPI00157B4C69|nr:hypothetical protein [Escherichia coli]
MRLCAGDCTEEQRHVMHSSYDGRAYGCSDDDSRAGVRNTVAKPATSQPTAPLFGCAGHTTQATLARVVVRWMRGAVPDCEDYGYLKAVCTRHLLVP